MNFHFKIKNYTMQLLYYALVLLKSRYFILKVYMYLFCTLDSDFKILMTSDLTEGERPFGCSSYTLRGKSKVL